MAIDSRLFSGQPVRPTTVQRIDVGKPPVRKASALEFLNSLTNAIILENNTKPSDNTYLNNSIGQLHRWVALLQAAQGCYFFGHSWHFLRNRTIEAAGAIAFSLMFVQPEK